MSRTDLIRRWPRILLGLLVFALGVHLTIHANIGLAPWDCLGMGVALHTPLNYGLAMTLMSVLILGLDLLMGEKIGCGTVIDALVTGNFVQLFNDLDPLPENHSLLFGVLFILPGLALMALGQCLYMAAGQGCGPRDALLVGLGRRLPGLPIGLVEVLLWAAVLLSGRLLGGPVGPGTLIATFGAGLMMQLVCALLRFEPRSVRHLGLRESLELLTGAQRNN